MVDDPGTPATSGPLEAVVRFEPAPEAGVASLRRHARTTQRPFERFVAERSGIDIERQFWAANAALVSVDLDSVGRDAILDVESVTTVHPNYAGTIHGAADGLEEPAVEPTPAQDGDADVAYHLEEMDVPQAWDVHGTRGEGVDVAVLDTGIDTSGHESLAASLERGGWAEFDERGERVDSAPNAQTEFPQAGHGTAISGALAGGATDDGTRYGVAPDVDLYMVQMKSRPPEGVRLLSVIAGVEWAIEQDVDIVSMSLGLPLYGRALVEPVRNAIESGVLVVAGMGNSGRFTGFSPANVPGVLSVGAVDDDRELYTNSSGERIDTERYWGAAAADSWPREYTVPDVTGPGVDALGPVLDGEYRRGTGTSFATPCVAGVAALAMAATDAGPETVRDAITETARHPAAAEAFDVDPGHDDRYGRGIVSALAAISRIEASEQLAGTVTDPSGRPLDGVTVGSGAGPTTETDAQGAYELTLPPGTQPVRASGPGLATKTTRLDPAETDTRGFQLDLTGDPGVALTDRMARRIDPGETAAATFDVANVESVVVEAETWGPFGAGGLELAVAGSPASLGEPVSVDPDRTRLTVRVGVPESTTIGQFRLSYEFTNGDASVGGAGHRVHVHGDPFVISPSDPPTLQAPVDLVAPRTTIELTDGEGVVTAGADADAGLVVDKPLTLTAADGATPTVRFSNDGAEQPAAVLVTANDVTVSGLTLNGEGADTGVQVGRDGAGARPVPTPSGVTISDLSVAGATTAIGAVHAPALRIADNEVTATATGIAVGERVPFRDSSTVTGRAKTTVRGNSISEVETGIDAVGRVAAVEGNTLSKVEATGIQVGTPRFLSRHWGQEIGPIRSNTVTDANRGVVVSGVVTRPVEENTLSDITAGALVVEGAVLAPIRDNSVDGAGTGLDVADGARAPTITGNELTDVRDPGDGRVTDGSTETGYVAGTDTAADTASVPATATTSDTPEATATDTVAADDSGSGGPVPGFGFGSALAALGGASYLLRQRLSDDGDDSR